MTFLIIDKDFLYQLNLGLIAPLFTGHFHEMFEKKLVFKIFKSWQVCPCEKKLATVTAHSELTVTNMVTVSRDLGRDWAVT